LVKRIDFISQGPALTARFRDANDLLRHHTIKWLPAT